LAPGGGPRYAWYEGRENKDGAKMKDTAQHLRTLEEIERDCIPGLVNVLREEGLEAVRYILWDMTGAPRLRSLRLARPRSKSASAGRSG
jgi:hypothetical protein